MKKAIALLLALAMTFALVACGNQDTPDNSEDGEKHYRIGIITGTQTQDYYVLGLKGAQSVIHEGDELIVYDNEQDISKQYDQIGDLISQQVDAIILAVIDADAMIPGLQLIADAGIPCFCYDQELSEEGEQYAAGQLYISDYTIGQLGGQAMAEALKQKNGEYKGKVMTYAASYYLAGELRLKGFNDALAEYPDIEVFMNSDEDWATDHAMGVIESVLMANPDMNGFWSWSELATIAAVKVFQENDCLDKMAITTNECSATMYDYVKNGYIYAGCELNGYGVGQDIVNMVYDYFEGKEVGKQEAAIFNVTADNLDEATTPFALS